MTCQLSDSCTLLPGFAPCRTIVQVTVIFFFFFNDTATTEIYTLSLHDALPISSRCISSRSAWLRASRYVSVAINQPTRDRKSTRLNSSHSQISYAVFCLKKKKKIQHDTETMYIAMQSTDVK